MPFSRKDETENLSILGKKVVPVAGKGPSAAMLEAFPNKFPGREYVISFAFPEFTSLCPVTGQPDFGVICLEYIPDVLCVESKSFKLYMFAYRNHQSFMETITNGILEDICSVIAPRWCRVRGLFAPRGGTRIHVFAESYKEMDAESDKKVRQAVASWLMQPNPHSYL